MVVIVQKRFDDRRMKTITNSERRFKVICASLDSKDADDMLPGTTNVTLYKRKLPCPPAVEFSSTKGMQIFTEALADGTMVGFFKLVEQYRTQTEPAYCGLTTLAMVLNALSIDPRRTWKAPWRWFDETLLDCCKPLHLVKIHGLSMCELACLARCNGAKVTMHSFGSFKLSTFRELIKASCKSVEQHIIVSYSRKVFDQTGDGHFSPIGGYHAASDHALILDTARFKYPPHWVPVPLLYTAMSKNDPVSMNPRGFLLMRAPDRPVSVYYTLSRADNWQEAEQYLLFTAPEVFKRKIIGRASLDETLKALVDGCPLESVQKFVAIRVGGSCCEGAPSQTHSKPFRDEFERVPLYQRVKECLEDRDAGPIHDEFLVGRITVLFLLKPSSLWLNFDASTEIKLHFEDLMDLTRYSLVKTEIEFLRHQMENLVAIDEIETPKCLCKNKATSEERSPDEVDGDAIVHPPIHDAASETKDVSNGQHRATEGDQEADLKSGVTSLPSSDP